MTLAIITSSEKLLIGSGIYLYILQPQPSFYTIFKLTYIL